MKTRKTYTLKKKMKAVKMVQDGRSQTEVGKLLDIPISNIQRWVSKYSSNDIAFSNESNLSDYQVVTSYTTYTTNELEDQQVDNNSNNVTLTYADIISMVLIVFVIIVIVSMFFI